MLVDHHCHLDFPDFSQHLPEVIGRATSAGVGLMTTICTRVRKVDAIRAIAERHTEVYFSVGTHPHNAHEELDIGSGDLVRLSQHPKCVAIGEAGLDYFYDKSPRAAQADGLARHIRAARETGLPLEIHSRDADEDMAAILERAHREDGPFPALLHCFTGGRDLAMRALDLGLYISFSGVISFKKSEVLRGIAAEVPLDRLLVETDAPYLAPEPFRGRPNEPAYVVHTAAALARVKGISPEEMARATTANVARLFTRIPRAMLGLEAAAA
jgi:TatD DNase family protein